MVNFLLKKMFRGNPNEAIPSVDMDVAFKVTSIVVNEIASFRLLRKISI